ncbi:hypothetical protein SOVF_148100 [Spinacia oleracea]|nr:hypothetical protein SOVF_148100 [Spinacia oleracea]
MGPPPPRQPARRLKSEVWNHFERKVINGEQKAKCLHCNQLFSGNSKNGTSHLKDHLVLRCTKKHMKVDVRQKLLAVNRRQDSSTRLENHVFNQEESRKELAHMVVLHEYPLSIVEHVGFRRFVISLNPSFKIISRNTLKSDILKMFVSEKANLKKLFDGHGGRVAITTDMWTASPQKKGYMAVTSHFIDDQWILHNKTLRIRNCVVFWGSTQKRLQKFEDKARASKVDCSRKLSLDCKTRWNSTFLMLQSALPYKNVFANLKTQNPKFKFVVPTQRDWESAETICDKLKRFHKVTELFSCRKYPTANLFFRQVCEIKLALRLWKNSNEQFVRDMAEKMIEKFDKYWSNINGILSVAAILDPRNKLECVEYYFCEIFGDEASVEVERVKTLLYDLLHEYHEKSDKEDVGSSSFSQTVLGKRPSDLISSDNVNGDDCDKWTLIKKTKKRKANVRMEKRKWISYEELLVVACCWDGIVLVVAVGMRWCLLLLVGMGSWDGAIAVGLLFCCCLLLSSSVVARLALGYIDTS